MEDSWGAEVYAQYGSTELGAGFIECEEHAGLHIHWDSFIVETLDPETQEPTDGEGELVFTTLRREATPLIRYRTGDLVRIVREECRCGRTSPRLFPEGRIDEMLKVKGTAVYPSVLREQLAEIREVTGFQVVVGKEGYLDTLELRIQTGTPGENLRSSVKDVVKAATGITPQVVFLPEGSLTPANGKARQFVDLRDARG